MYGKYKKLALNTALFAMSTVGSKIMLLAMQRVYTSLLSPEQFSIADMTLSTGNLILPLMCLCITDSVIRFGLDTSIEKKDVFSAGIFISLAGFSVMLLFYPLISRFSPIGGYGFLLYCYLLSSVLRAVVIHFVRVTGHVRLYAADGFVTTATTIVLTLILLSKFNFGVSGYILGIVIADTVSAITLFFYCRLHHFIKISVNKETVVAMLKYAIPLVPSAVFWWVATLSDKYFVQAICGDFVNGIYGKAYLLPTIITILAAVFNRAWQLSAFTEHDDQERVLFFSNVFRVYSSLIFVGTSALILFIKPALAILLNPLYYDAWRYTPFLLLAVAALCFGNFVESIYQAAKKNLMITATTCFGAVINILFNSMLIPRIGAQGAAVATFVSFMLVFILRAVNSRKHIQMDFNPVMMFINFGLLLIQCLLILLEGAYWPIWNGTLFLLILAVNLKSIVGFMRVR